MKNLFRSRLSLKLVFALGLGAFLVLALLLVGTLSNSTLFYHTISTHIDPVNTHPVSHAQAKSTNFTAPQGPALNDQTQVIKSALKDSNSPALPFKSGIRMSGGGCYSYNTSSSDANVATSGYPVLYGYDGSDAPMIGLVYDYCDNLIIVRIATNGYDYYKVNWWRPGRSGWSQYTTSLEASELSNAHANTYYQFTVEGCYSHWYGDSCKSWSPRVNISTY